MEAELLDTEFVQKQLRKQFLKTKQHCNVSVHYVIVVPSLIDPMLFGIIQN